MNKQGLPNYKYQFQGVETEESFELHWQETEWRSYDTQLGRFHQLEPLADFFVGISPYQFGYNNPINFKDPSGLGVIGPDKPGVGDGAADTGEEEDIFGGFDAENSEVEGPYRPFILLGSSIFSTTSMIDAGPSTGGGGGKLDKKEDELGNLIYSGYHDSNNTSLGIIILDNDQYPDESGMIDQYPNWNFVYSYNLGDAMKWIKKTYKGKPKVKNLFIRHHGAGRDRRPGSNRSLAPHDYDPVNNKNIQLSAKNLKDFVDGKKLNDAKQRLAQSYYDLGDILDNNSSVAISACRCGFSDMLVNSLHSMLSRNGSKTVSLYMNMDTSDSLLDSSIPNSYLLKVNVRLTFSKSFDLGWKVKTNSIFLDSLLNTFKFNLLLKTTGGFKPLAPK